MKLTFYIVFFLNLIVQAQTIKVLDKLTNLPIQNVLITNATNSIEVVTDSKGKVDLTVFQDENQVYFHHINYEDFILKYPYSSLVLLDKKTRKLDEIILKSSKSQTSIKKIAEQNAVVTSNEIKQINPQTSADLLFTIPGVNVQKSQFGGGSPVLRGMEANRVLLVVDGVRMNNAIYRKGHLQNSITVNPNILERVEIMFGPSSVMYGSDALGGVVHFYTKTPNFSNFLTVNGENLFRYSTANNEITNNFSFSIAGKKISSYTSVAFSDFGDVIMGENRHHGFEDWGKVNFYSNNIGNNFHENSLANPNPNIQKNTSFKQFDFLQKVRFLLAESANLTLNTQYSSASPIHRFDKLNEINASGFRFAEWNYNKQDRFLFSPQLSFTTNRKWFKKGTITFGYQKIKEGRTQRNYNSLNRYLQFENLDVYSLNADFIAKTAKNRNLSYGIEFVHNDLRSTSKGEVLNVNKNKVTVSKGSFDTQTRYPDGGSSYSSSSAYLAYRQKISSKLVLNTGTRINFTNLFSKWEDDFFVKLPSESIVLNNLALTGTLALVFKPRSYWQYNVVLSSGFRSPNIDDVGKVREKNGSLTIPNISLKPEYAYNFELGFQRFFNSNRFSIGGSFYYTLLDNYIYRESLQTDYSNIILPEQDIINIVSNVNKGIAYIYGGSLGFKGYLLPNLSLIGSLTYTKGKSFDLKEPLSSIPPLFADFTCNYKKEKITLGTSLKFNAKKKVSDFNVSEGIDNIEQTPILDSKAQRLEEKYYGTPSWLNTSCFIGYQINNSISLNLNLDNIFDVHYKSFASGVSSAGRNVSLSLYSRF